MGVGREFNLFGYILIELKKVGREVVGDWRQSRDSRLFRVIECVSDDLEGRKDGFK